MSHLPVLFAPSPQPTAFVIVSILVRGGAPVLLVSSESQIGSDGPD